MMHVLILVSSIVVLGYALCAFGHMRVRSADLSELERLHEEGLLPATNTLEQDFRTVTYLLSAIAPAICMRQEVWVRVYYVCLRVSRLVASSSSSLEAEMRRLVAFQSANYRIACARLEELTMG